MIKFEKTEVMGWQQAIRGMRNPMNSWDKSDSGICKGGDDGIGCENCAAYDCGHTYDYSFQLGKNDMGLMRRLRNAGTDHRKFMRMITVYVDITAPLYWWKEFDTYKVGTVANSCSTMHKIADKEFTLEDFSTDYLFNLSHDVTSPKINGLECTSIGILEHVITALNFYRNLYLETGLKPYWWQMIQLLPSSYNQKRTVLLNYEVLANIYKSRKGHKLDEWCLHRINPIEKTKNGFIVSKNNSVPFNTVGFCDWIERLPYSELITGNFKEDVE